MGGELDLGANYHIHRPGTRTVHPGERLARRLGLRISMLSQLEQKRTMQCGRTAEYAEMRRKKNWEQVCSFVPLCSQVPAFGKMRERENDFSVGFLSATPTPKSLSSVATVVALDDRSEVPRQGEAAKTVERTFHGAVGSTMWQRAGSKAIPLRLSQKIGEPSLVPVICSEK